MYDTKLIINLPKDLKEKMKAKAQENCQTVSDYLRSLVIKDLREGK